jgi:glutaredoxin 3
MAADVVMYRTPLCPYCIRAKFLLEKKRARFQEIDVSGNREMRAWLVRATGRRTVPQIFINGLSIGGCDEMYALERAGRLDGLLAQEPTADAAFAKKR